MNKDNYVSPEVAQRLADNGIVLDTDMFFQVFDKEITRATARQKKCWEADASKGYADTNVKFIPSPCFAELWSELAKYKASCYHSNGVTLAVIEGSPSFYNINPADAIAELLIRVKG